MVQLTLLVVPLAGLEPARGLPRGILSPNINHKAQYIVGLINLNHDILCFFNRFPKLPKRQMHKIKYYYFINYYEYKTYFYRLLVLLFHPYFIAPPFTTTAFFEQTFYCKNFIYLSVFSSSISILNFFNNLR